MDKEQRKQFEIICETAKLIIESYQHSSFWPKWLFQRTHSRIAHVNRIITAIDACKDAVSPQIAYDAKLNELLRLLDNYRFYFSTHTISQRLREKVQDAMLAVFSFQSHDIQSYQRYVIDEQKPYDYIQHFIMNEKLKHFREYYASRHMIYGQSKQELGESDLTIASKSALINSYMVERFGIKTIIDRNLSRIKQELHEFIENKIEVGFLTIEAALGYINKIDLIMAADPEIYPDTDTIMTSSRYLIEDVINTAGVKSLGPAKHLEHAVLIASCYWVDEMLQQAKAKIEYDLA